MINRKMLWIIQAGFEKEPGYNYFIEALERMDSEYIMVTYQTITNGSGYLTSDDEKFSDQLLMDRLIFVIGGYSISKYAKQQGWIPGSFLNDNFNYSAWIQGYGKENMLNGEMTISTIQESIVKDPNGSIFVRPVEDSKAFSGKVFTGIEYLDFKHKVMSKEITYSSLNEHTEVMIAPVVSIYSETRFYVLDQKIITQSLYKRGSQVVYSRDVDPYIIDYARSMVEKWQPNTAFVIDIADTEEGLKIVELNNLNSAGLYDADCFKIIDAIEQFYQ